MKPINDCKTLVELFADESRWTKGTYARNSVGMGVSPADLSATCFCAAGGLNKVYGPSWKHHGVAWSKLQKKIRPDGLYFTVAAWNDGSSYEEVYSVIKELNI